MKTLFFTLKLKIWKFSKFLFSFFSVSLCSFTPFQVSVSYVSDLLMHRFFFLQSAGVAQLEINCFLCSFLYKLLIRGGSRRGRKIRGEFFLKKLSKNSQ